MNNHLVRCVQSSREGEEGQEGQEDEREEIRGEKRYLNSGGEKVYPLRMG